jgi:hypothetical protein
MACRCPLTSVLSQRERERRREGETEGQTN